MNLDIIYKISKDFHDKENLIKILKEHDEIQFVSLCGIDLLGNDTDEKIPIKLFLEDIDTFLYGVPVKTDGSSVNLPGIATLNNAKVDMKIDLDAVWRVDYNYENIDKNSNKPIGTLRIPSFLIHEEKHVDSRSILKSSITYFKECLFEILKNNTYILNEFNITFDDIENIDITTATELEFWVKTPNDLAEIEELSTSEVLKEQYWKRTKGCVRTALEESLILMDKYGFEPEMGHKEVGGVKAKLNSKGGLTHIMEQLEIDWKYSNAIDCCDGELVVRNLIIETFRRHGLEVTFQSKPIENVAGNGKHIHLGVTLKLKNGERVNLFHLNEDYLSLLGYASLMGILHNYEVINPFISNTIDSLKRLKPGFEAPICVSTSLGLSKDMPSRNRTILVALIKELESALSTRFEVRSPNPYTNCYLSIASMILAMLDGINYAINNNRSRSYLEKELCKEPGEFFGYLEKERLYRTEDNLFTKYKYEDLETYFGKIPKTVYENIISFEEYEDKCKILQVNNIFSDEILRSYQLVVLEKYITEIEHRLLPKYMNEIRSYKNLCDHTNSYIDSLNWNKVNRLRIALMKDTEDTPSLFSKIRFAINNGNFKEVSSLQLEIDEKMSLLRKTYTKYKENLLDI